MNILRRFKTAYFVLSTLCIRIKQPFTALTVSKHIHKHFTQVCRQQQITDDFMILNHPLTVWMTMRIKTVKKNT